MNEFFSLIILYILSYLLGSLPTAFLIGKIAKGIDIRTHGSGNVGATNAFRVLGKRWGVLSLVIDIVKGSLAVFVTKLFVSDSIYLSWILLGSGLMAFLGHLFPLWLRFKGGKGVAVAAGVFFFLLPIETGITLLFFIVIVSVTRYVSLGSILSAGVLPILIYFNISYFNKTWVTDYPYFIIACIISLGVIIMHSKNIKRLVEGSESKIFSSDKAIQK
ncbi:MAG: glycerol-3-phosphate 1-O-acyltransferase PlsY [Spirochaetota bacterium]|nr:glycerol-3-phosphate 1-O-acyltransferase PlsY [Spirochaetota bacterium]